MLELLSIQTSVQHRGTGQVAPCSYSAHALIFATSSFDRARIFDQFSQDVALEIRIIFAIRIMDEGIDLVKTDAVFYDVPETVSSPTAPNPAIRLALV